MDHQMAMRTIISEGIRSSSYLKNPSVIYLKRALKYNAENFKNQIVSSCTNRIKILYSIKACTNYEVIDYISNFVSGFSASSDNEYDLVKKFFNKRISLTGYAFNYKKMKYVFDNNNIFYFSSINQLKWICHLYPDLIKGNFIALRLKGPRTTFEVNQKLESRFGISLDQLEEIKKLKEEFHFQIADILIHSENKVLKDSIV